MLSRMRFEALQAEFAVNEMQRVRASLEAERDALQVRLAVIPRADELDRTALSRPENMGPEASLVDSLARLHLQV